MQHEKKHKIHTDKHK